MLGLRLANSPVQHHAIHKLRVSFFIFLLWPKDACLCALYRKLSKPQYQALLVMPFNVKIFLPENLGFVIPALLNENSLHLHGYVLF